MGIVKISDDLHDAAKQMAKAMNRSINSQAEHWMRMGKIVEEHPEMYNQIRTVLLQISAAEH